MADIFDLFRKIGSTSSEGTGPITHIVAGLGNPGAEYEGTRHNAGFMAMDVLGAHLGVRIDRLRFRALTAEATLGGARVLLLKPQTFMNLSGEAIAAAATFYKIPAERVLVICDDISFSPGRLRIRRRGSAGGHNGLKSIIASLGADTFVRFRVGVGEKPSPDADLIAHVLGRFPPADRAALDGLLQSLPDALSLWIAGREEEAMNRFSK